MLTLISSTVEVYVSSLKHSETRQVHKARDQLSRRGGVVGRRVVTQLSRRTTWRRLDVVGSIAIIEDRYMA
jgi:hypothetical protein